MKNFLDEDKSNLNCGTIVMIFLVNYLAIKIIFAFAFAFDFKLRRVEISKQTNAKADDSNYFVCDKLYWRYVTHNKIKVTRSKG